MKRQNIENWALKVIENVQSGVKFEDDFVELKRKWINPQKAARRIAGHANAARGNDIIWLIGVDEEQGIQEFKQVEIANWWEQVQSNFSSFSPSLTHLNLSVDEKLVIVLHFETYNAPYIVKNPSFGKPNGGPVQREIPWRVGTSTKSAKRENLIRLLVPLNKLPEIEFLEGRVTAKIKEAQEHTSGHIRPKIRNKPHIEWNFYLEFYLTPKWEEVVLPVHRTRFKFKIENGSTDFIKAPVLKYRTPTKPSGRRSKIDSHTIRTTNSEAIISGPGRLKIKVEYYEATRKLEKDSDLIFQLDSRPSGTQYEISKTIKLPFIGIDTSKSEKVYTWELNNIETESYWA